MLGLANPDPNPNPNQAVGRSALREQQRLGAAPEAVRAMAAEAGALLREELAASGRVPEEATPD